MSVAIMTLVWKTALPSGQKIVLLALADNCNDQGVCYPSISTIAEKCSVSERSVFNHIDAFKKAGVITVENRNGRSTVYTLHPCKFCTPANSAPLQPLHPTPATVAPPPLQPLHPTPATVAPITINEPSIEPPLESSLKNKQKKSANSLNVDWQYILVEAGVSKQVADDFVEHRKKKKAALTKTVLDGFTREAAIAGISLDAALRETIERNWIGFRASWYENAQGSGQQPTQQRVYVSKQAQLEANSDAVVAAFHARLDREANEQANTVEMA